MIKKLYIEFNYMIKVMNSCKNWEQFYNTKNWCNKVIKKLNEEAEKDVLFNRWNTFNLLIEKLQMIVNLKRAELKLLEKLGGLK